MTPAERPTQEVAPRTAAGRALLADYYSTPERRERVAAMIALIEAEASRSAPPATVTAEQLAEILKAEGFVRGMAHRYGTFNDAYWEQSAARILSKITPAQPSASSEGDRDPDTDMPWTPEPDPWGKS